MSTANIFTQSVCWHFSFKTPKLLQVFSQAFSFFSTGDLTVVYVQVNGNKRLVFSRSVSKSVVVSVGL